MVAVTDPSRLGDALARGELPIELLVAGSLIALALGFALTLLVGALRRRRSVRDPDSALAASPENVRDSRPTLPWPTQDADAFWPAPRPSASPLAIEEPAPTPFRPDTTSAPLDAARAEAWAAHEATTEIARQTAGWASDAPADAGPETATASEPALRPAPTEEAGAADTNDRGATAVGLGRTDTADAFPTWERTHPPLPATAMTAVESRLATQADIRVARSTLGTPEAPLVVELRDERETDAGRRVGPNPPLVVAIGTVAAGVAFSAGAAVGAALGAGAGAAIGLAFAGGAGVAIGATVALLGGNRR